MTRQAMALRCSKPASTPIIGAGGGENRGARGRGGAFAFHRVMRMVMDHSKAANRRAETWAIRAPLMVTSGTISAETHGNGR